MGFQIVNNVLVGDREQPGVTEAVISTGLAGIMGFRIENNVLVRYREQPGVTEIVIPTGVTSIGEGAFFNCRSLVNITIPESVTEIGEQAFSQCSSLMSITIPGGVTRIGRWAFDHCTCLTNITIPENVTQIGTWAFNDCSSLINITILGSATDIDKEAFTDCTFSEIRISDDVMNKTRSPELWMCAIKTLSLENLTRIIKRCPKKLIPDAEMRIMKSDSVMAVRYFEQLNRLDEYAAFHNTDADTLRDSILSDFGLDENGCRSWTLAGKQYTARMENNLSITLLDDNGKELKSLPKKGADPAEFDTAKKELAQLRKDIPSAAKLRNNRLLADWLETRPRKVDAWKQTYLVNPLLKALAKLVVWQQDKNTFILNADEIPVDVTGIPVELTESDIVLAHPMEMGKELTAAWQNYFTRNHLSQPFAQVWEPVLDGTSIRPDRYEGTTIPLYMLMNKDLHGITMEGQSKLKLRDCSADLKLMSSSTDWVNNQFEISNFRFEKFTRAVNHIAAHFDKGTVQGRLLKDDASAAQWMDYFTLVQITEFINLVTEKGDCPNSAAALLEYKNAKYPDADPFAEFVLDL